MRVTIGQNEYGIVSLEGRYHSFIRMDGNFINLGVDDTQELAIRRCKIHYFTLNSKPVELLKGHFYIVDDQSIPLYLYRGPKNYDKSLPGPLKM